MIVTQYDSQILRQAVHSLGHHLSGMCNPNDRLTHKDNKVNTNRNINHNPTNRSLWLILRLHQLFIDVLLSFADTPILTACQLRRQQVIGQSSSGHLIGTFIPRCTADGYFEPVQCHGSTGECWCVDRVEGLELIGSRQRVPSMPDCTRFTGKVPLT